VQSDSDRLIAVIAEQHHGVFTTVHARAVGFQSADIHWRVVGERWRPLHHGVYRLAGAPLSWRGALLAGCWAGGTRAAASHRSAAQLWLLPGGSQQPIEIVCPRWRRAQHADLAVHETKVLDALDLTEIDGIPVTTVGRTLLDLGAVRGPRTVELALENALRRELTTTAALRPLLRRLGRQGRNGAGVLRALLDERDPERRVTESDMEMRLLHVLRRNGLPEPVPQFEIYVGRSFVARVDFAYPQWRIAIEYESYQEHTGKAALNRDNPRWNAIITAKWKPLGATPEDVKTGGRQLCTQIRDAIRLAS
jgi:predicted transcriptional regulator of viral defense system